MVIEVTCEVMEHVTFEIGSDDPEEIGGQPEAFYTVIYRPCWQHERGSNRWGVSDWIPVWGPTWEVRC